LPQFHTDNTRSQDSNPEHLALESRNLP
jgi:hypothetical protein